MSDCTGTSALRACHSPFLFRKTWVSGFLMCCCGLSAVESCAYTCPGYLPGVSLRSGFPGLEHLIREYGRP
jgi:hypothetical protein